MEGDDIKTSVTKETSPVLVDKRGENLTETELKEHLAISSSEPSSEIPGTHLKDHLKEKGELSAVLVVERMFCTWSLPRKAQSLYATFI